MLEDKLQSRKKQFHVLVQSIHRLQDLIDQEEEATDAMVAAVHSVNMSKEEGLVESDDDTAKDELNTSNVSSSPEDGHMDVSWNDFKKRIFSIFIKDQLILFI